MAALSPLAAGAHPILILLFALEREETQSNRVYPFAILSLRAHIAPLENFAKWKRMIVP
jgi:hypothetical protein